MLHEVIYLHLVNSGSIKELDMILLFLFIINIIYDQDIFILSLSISVIV